MGEFAMVSEEIKKIRALKKFFSILFVRVRIGDIPQLCDLVVCVHIRGQLFSPVVGQNPQGPHSCCPLCYLANEFNPWKHISARCCSAVRWEERPVFHQSPTQPSPLLPFSQPASLPGAPLKTLMMRASRSAGVCGSGGPTPCCC